MMGTEVTWLVEGRILRAVTGFTLDDIQERDKLLLQMMDEGGQPPAVHIIFDYSTISPRDAGQFINAIQEYAKRAGQRDRRVSQHPLLGWLISVKTPSAALQFVGSTLSRVGKYQRHSCDTVDEALRFLQSKDDTLTS